MKDIFILYDNCCFYEIVTLNFFMSFTDCEVVFCSLDGKSIKAMEGYSVNVDMKLYDVDLDDVRTIVIPGGKIANINKDSVRELLRCAYKRGVLVAGICAGVDILDEAGLLADVKSTHSTDLDITNDNNIITARANAYVDFAIEVASKLKLFKDENDLKETIDFWKFHKRMW